VVQGISSSTIKAYDASGDLIIHGSKKIKLGKIYKYNINSNFKISNKKIKWAISNKKYAKISKNGKLKPLRKGRIKMSVKVGNIKSELAIRII